MEAQLEHVVLKIYHSNIKYEQALREFQNVFVIIVLREQKGNQCGGPDALGIHRNTLRRIFRTCILTLGLDATRSVDERLSATA